MELANDARVGSSMKPGNRGNIQMQQHPINQRREDATRGKQQIQDSSPSLRSGTFQNFHFR
jgi:hypothetical protein